MELGQKNTKNKANIQKILTGLLVGAGVIGFEVGLPVGFEMNRIDESSAIQSAKCRSTYIKTISISRYL